MTTATVPIRKHEEFFSFDNVSWGAYEFLLNEMDWTGRKIRITYDRGRMALMTLSAAHEWDKTLLGQMIEIATLEKGIRRRSFGSTTWMRADLAKGLESDECYYIQHEEQVRGRDKIDLYQYPPPDLVVEVEVTHFPLDRLSIYAALKVPEVWHDKGQKIEFLHLERGRYRAVKRSVSLPFLAPTDIQRFLTMAVATDELTAMQAFRDWLKSG